MTEDLDRENGDRNAVRRVRKSAAWSASVIATAIGASSVGELTGARQSSVSR
ncbi:hypothetical protein CVS47_00511 [Microbacterium lemovicicum]|uniref:Uncharacterized protein n=1 Tax=Microbacterium lemovicicum TaxID=1072463 RepID=A0A3Q9IWG5_9MICO|nr:hypothetical protein [Microbacterium lemovicicum]AZS35913.1 hypothetical protein CVS47_00511 [Microbacterium lemovicicum]